MSVPLISLLLNSLRDKRKLVPLEDQNTRVEVDLTIKNEKPEFIQVVTDLQTTMMNQVRSHAGEPSVCIELGAGVLPMSAQFHNVRSTDVVASAHLDGVLDATNLDLPDDSVDALLLQNTFHHIPDPDAFFTECIRVLQPGGRVIILDPYFNFLSSKLYKVLFSTESFDKAGSWEGASGHAMIGANQALSYIVFKRDRERFDATHGDLKIVKHFPAPQGLRYLLTGGLNFRRIAPKFLFPIIRKCETYGALLNWFAIHWVVVLEKN